MAASESLVFKEGRIRSQVNFPLEETGTCAPFLPPFPTPPTSEVDLGGQGGDREKARVGGGGPRVSPQSWALDRAHRIHHVM